MIAILWMLNTSRQEAALKKMSNKEDALAAGNIAKAINNGGAK